MYKIVLLGSDINVYYMSRCYHELTGQRPNVLGKEPMRFTKYSHLLNISYNEDLRKPDKFAKILIDYYKDNFTKEDKVLLVPCHDVYVRLVVENRDKLNKYYSFNCPNYDLMDSFLVKEKFYETYEGELDFAKTYFYDVKTELNIPKNFMYPLIIKPSDGLEYYHHHFPGQAKVYRLDTYEEVVKVVKDIKDSGYQEKLIIQEYIPGDDTLLFDSIFYFNTKGEAELSTLAQIGLQEHRPSALGNCTVLINNYNEYGGTKEIITKLKSFLEKHKYTGFAEFDLKYDTRDHKFKVLEINPRQARSSYYLAACGYNLVKYLLEDIFENKTHKYTFIEKEVLLSMVPKYVIKKYIKDEKYKQEALKMYKAKLVYDPLNYSKDRSFKHDLYLLERALKYIKSYKEYKW